MIKFSQLELEDIFNTVLKLSIEKYFNPFFGFNKERYRRLSLLSEHNEEFSKSLKQNLNCFLKTKIDKHLLDCLNINFMWNSPLGFHVDEAVPELTALLVLNNGFRSKTFEQLKSLEKEIRAALGREHLKKFKSSRWISYEDSLDWEDLDMDPTVQSFDARLSEFNNIKFNPKKGKGSQSFYAQPVTLQDIRKFIDDPDIEFEPSYDISSFKKYEAQVGDILPFFLQGTHGVYLDETPDKRLQSHFKEIGCILKNEYCWGAKHSRSLEKVTPASLHPSLLTMSFTLKTKDITQETAQLFFDSFCGE